jgi:hypothetical protein
MTKTLNLSLLLAALALPLASCGRSADEERMEKLSGEIDEINKEFDDQRRQQLDEQGFAEGSPEQAERLAAAMRAAGAGASPEQAMLLEAGASFTQEMATLSRSYYELVNAFVGAGGYDPASLTTAEAIDARRAMVDELDAANSDFLTTMNELKVRHPREIRALAAKGVPRSEINAYLAGFEASTPNFELARQIRRTDTDLCRHGREYLAVLRENFGSWEVMPDGQIQFGESISDATMERFNTAAQGMATASQEQADLQRRQLEASGP